MSRPRKAQLSADPLLDLAKKTEILEREMSTQQAAMERLKQIGSVRPRPQSAEHAGLRSLQRRVSR